MPLAQTPYEMDETVELVPEEHAARTHRRLRYDGDSYHLTIAPQIVQAAGLEANDWIRMTAYMEDGRIVLEKVEEEEDEEKDTADQSDDSEADTDDDDAGGSESA